MAVRITSLVNYLLNVPGPIETIFEPRQSLTFEFIEYDWVINDERINELIEEKRIEVIDLEPVDSYVSGWNEEPKLKLGPYVFWVDAVGSLRIKNGDPTSDLDGAVVGPGSTPGPHGSTHVFTGTDPIPDIEVLEIAWTCPATVVVNDVVYQTGGNSVDKAQANTTTTMPAIGVVLLKPTATTCIIARSGEVPGLTLAADVYYYVSATTAGGLTATPPNTSGNVVQQVGYAKTTSTLVVELSRPLKKA